MNIQFYFEKLYSMENFQKFRKENPDSFLCSGFFTIDKEGEDNKAHFDYFIPKEKKMNSFQLENKEMVPMDIFSTDSPKEVPSDLDIEFNEVEELIIKRMGEEEIKNKLQKIILSLQMFDGEVSLVGTAFISGMGMIKININVKEMKIVEFEKKSFFDILKVTSNKN